MSKIDPTRSGSSPVPPPRSNRSEGVKERAAQVTQAALPVLRDGAKSGQLPCRFQAKQLGSDGPTEKKTLFCFQSIGS